MGPGKSVHYKEVFTNQGCSLWEVSLYFQNFVTLQNPQVRSHKKHVVFSILFTHHTHHKNMMYDKITFYGASI